MEFGKHRGAFRDRSTWEVARAFAILTLCSIDALTRNSLQVLRRVPQWLLRHTLYAQFVGGEEDDEVRRSMRSVRRVGLRPMLAATMEEDLVSSSWGRSSGGEKERVLESNCKRIVHSLRLAAEEEGGMVQLKLSGLVRPDLLANLGRVYSGSGDCGRLQVVEAIARGLTDDGCLQLTPLGLTREDRDALTRAVHRLKKIGREAESSGVRVLVDAESTPLNDGLSALALAGAIAFNSRHPIVWNTYQCYLKDAGCRVRGELSLLRDGVGVAFGAKVVRGAYMLQENPDSLCEDYSATSSNYHSVLSFLLERAGARCQLIAATHNEESIRYAIRRMREVNADHSHVCFGQLYGMADHISYPLARAGFAVYKSIPYGSVKEVLPYMARRAIENQSVIQGACKERSLLSKELGHRIRRAIFRK